MGGRRGISDCLYWYTINSSHKDRVFNYYHSIFVGAIAGQLSMGYLGDLIGRTKALFFTLLLASFGGLGSALFSHGSPESIYAIIIMCRFILGIGVGGVYPLSATKAAEDSSAGGGKVNSVESAKSFFWQSPGAIAPW